MSGERREQPMKDGQALDRLTENVETWAKSYRHVDDEERWERDFLAKFDSQAADLARRSTASTRSFGARDWILAVVFWSFLAFVVFIGSVLLMQLEGTWRIVFAVFAALIAAVGIWQSYLEATSVKRHADKLEKKREWLLGVTRKVMTRTLVERRTARGRS
ncbi:hypothetical protein F8O01_09635 [Pseudoclavibacter chungangensis]|uniref:Uncharacterized protein n=1 Tax=Pseudoclavibacter chungangensis TaxID=587635 RepID=A0A7J5BRL6_9MICO|nr:hypothetical protein [Pseudoclavibacter chungangensis]KAB1656895.1 hypothetical protein F8O01_09635 [Pseudoclavibacter chungangensis]NYJ67362.1 hypothetical protein [Pseudoclavibacter chungangensis]